MSQKLNEKNGKKIDVKRFYKNFLIFLYYVISIIIISIALLVSAGRMLAPALQAHQSAIIKKVSETIGYPLHVQKLSASWLGLHPVLKLSQVDILDNVHQRSVLHINKIYFSFNVLRSIFSQQLSISQFVLSNSDVLIFENSENQYFLGGPSGISLMPDQETSSIHLLKFIFSEEQISLRKIYFHFKKNSEPEYKIYLEHLNLLNDGKHHRLFGNLQLNKNNSSELKIVVDLIGQANHLEQWHAKIFIQGEKVNFEPWIKKLNFSKDIFLSGEVDFSLWMEWKNLLKRLELKINWDQPILKLSSQPQYNFQMQKISGIFSWINLDGKNWILSGEKIALNKNGTLFPESSFYISKNIKNDVQWNIYLKYFDISEIISRLSYTSEIPESIKNFLYSLKPQGMLDYLCLTLNVNQGKVLSYKLKTNFENLSLKAYEQWPEIHGLNGVMEADRDKGYLELFSEKMSLYFPKLFRQPQAIEKFYTRLDFNKENEGFFAYTDSLYLKNRDVEGLFNVLLKIPNDFNEPVIQLSGQARLLNFKNVSTYIPSKIMSASLVGWLDQAIPYGHYCEAQIILNGPLSHFPYADYEGRFKVESQLKNISLNYYPLWPSISNIDGTLRFDTQQMMIEVQKGKVFSTSMHHAKAYISDLLHPQLNVSGHLDGSLQDGLRFLKEGPFRKKSGSLMNSLEASGGMGLDLALTIPFSNLPIKIEGTTTVSDGKLRVLNENMVLDHIHTVINFTEKSIDAGNSSAKFQKYPFGFSIHTKNAGSKASHFQINFNSEINVEDLKKKFNLNFLNPVTGHFHYQALVDIPSDNNYSKLTVNSNLLGVKINLPAPLSKNANQSIPSQFSVYLGTPEWQEIKFMYGNEIAGLLKLKKILKDYHFYNGDMNLSGSQIQSQTLPGLFIHGNLKNFNIDTWKNYLHSAQSSSKSSNSVSSNSWSHFISRFDVQLPTFHLNDFLIPPMHLKGNKYLKAWKIEFNSQPFIGSVTLPENNSELPIEARFKRLFLKKSNKTSHNDKPLNPKNIPSINLLSDETVLNDHALGHVQLKLRAYDTGLTIPSFRIHNRNYSMVGRANWFIKNEKSLAHIEGKIISDDLKKTLQEWGITPNIEAKDVDIQFNLSWLGTLTNPNIPSMYGIVSIMLGKGRILGISEGANLTVGLGRILNLLSFETLSRRLRLDFSDLTQKGYTFERMTGEFILKNGRAVTRDAKFTGDVADVIFSGRIGYVDKTYNLYLAIIPDFTSSLSLVATLTGGPIAGLAAIAANKILNPGLKKVTTYHYSLNGSWNNPNIKKVDSEKKE